MSVNRVNKTQAANLLDTSLHNFNYHLGKNPTLQPLEYIGGRPVYDAAAVLEWAKDTEINARKDRKRKEVEAVKNG